MKVMTDALLSSQFTTLLPVPVENSAESQQVLLSLSSLSYLPTPTYLRFRKNPVHHRSLRLAASPAATTVKKKPPKPLTSEERDWLTAKVEAMDGFETFKKHPNQHLNNLSRVLYWKFAADFTRKYYKTEWPILRVDHEHSNGTLIRKHALETVLNMKTTALNQAINMSRILDKCYHGATKSREVVDSVENTESQSLGSEVLVNFLLAWDKEHLGFGVN
ncbi:hypothetical protein C8F04DRAFT_1266665 [Mycena alexandri]|uniref:Uncharacterized protein n=1 Tax=Mycena alexandri TaxID=1745969 RepID=A0AAD6SLE1_9AGAR|nr:hypothetical protein C8F04DRAFT_1266665 [Mycena alexandri]